MNGIRLQIYGRAHCTPGELVETHSGMCETGPLESIQCGYVEAALRTPTQNFSQAFGLESDDFLVVGSSRSLR